MNPRRQLRGFILAYPPPAVVLGASLDTPVARKPGSVDDPTFTAPTQVRNFCILARIAHGEPTLAGRCAEFSLLRRTNGDTAVSTNG
jgi:hypothetical protein